MITNIFQIILMFLELILCFGQRTGYNETCNSTEECSDHRYKCQRDEKHVLRCLCDRFHAWDDDVGCVQIYNASQIVNMTVSVTDNIRFLEEQVEVIVKIQIAAGLFIFGMVIVATVTVTIFCVYVHIKDRPLSKSKSAKAKANRQQNPRFPEPKPSTSISIV